ncbi:protein PAXX [Nelusetta ayraudi]|uniref:protein PAXX n=1 Tax=Nelusetta ayraudi TaxID=303726 RepID=UPI003F6E9AB0
MAGHQTFHSTVWDKNRQSKFLLYTHRKNERLHVCVTDVVSVWRTEHTEESPKQPMFSAKSREDLLLKLSSASGKGDVSVVVSDGSVELHAGGHLSATLPRLEDQQGAAELRELLFRMADALAEHGATCASPAVSPVKHQKRRAAEFEPRQLQSSAPFVVAKKRPAGASLINPGCKKKAKATGVAFDDADED